MLDAHTETDSKSGVDSCVETDVLPRAAVSGGTVVDADLPDVDGSGIASMLASLHFCIERVSDRSGDRGRRPRSHASDPTMVAIARTEELTETPEKWICGTHEMVDVLRATACIALDVLRVKGENVTLVTWWMPTNVVVCIGADLLYVNEHMHVIPMCIFKTAFQRD